MPSPKPQPWYASLNQPPRSPSHGQHRRTPAPSHGNPTDGAGAEDNGATANCSVIRTAIPAGPGGITFVSGQAPNPSVGQITPHDLWLSQQQLIEWLMPPPPPPIPYAGIRTGEITAFRAWKVVDDLDLCSLAHYFIWEPGATIEGDIKEVVSNCTYGMWSIYGGVYTHHTMELTVEDIGEIDTRFRGLISVEINGAASVCRLHGIAFGSVKLWGDVIEHKRGYRASHAKLVSIDKVVGAVDPYALRRKYLVD